MLYAEYDPEVEMRVVREEALEEGEERGKIKIAKNLLSEGLTPEFVQRNTGLSLEKIEELL